MKALVIGYGSIGRRHINNLSLLPHLEILVCTKHGQDDFLRKKRCKIFNSLEKCLDEKPDIVFVTNVTSDHIKTALKLANSGIHLFIEKPLSNSMSGVKTLLDTVKKRKLVTLMGCNMRFHPCIHKIKELILENQIGRVISVLVENGSFLPGWHQDEDYRQGYVSRKDLGGGAILTNIHEIDYLYWFFGNVKEVYSITGKFSDLDISVDDLSCLLLQFKNDVIAEVHLDYFQNPSFRSCKVIGTNGTIYWDSEINIVKVYDIKKKIWIEKLKLKNYDENAMYIEELSHFIDCVKNNKKTINSVHDGAKTLKIVLNAKKASKIKKAIIID